MICGGSARVFVELLAAAPALLMFGGGHVGLALARLGGELGIRRRRRRRPGGVRAPGPFPGGGPRRPGRPGLRASPPTELSRGAGPVRRGRRRGAGRPTSRRSGPGCADAPNGALPRPDRLRAEGPGRLLDAARGGRPAETARGVHGAHRPPDRGRDARGDRRLDPRRDDRRPARQSAVATPEWKPPMISTSRLR